MANKIDRQFLIQKLKEEPQNLTNDEKAQIIEFINTKRYGLVWENSTEKAYEQMKDYIPVLVEDENHRLVSDNDDAPNHILIEGDNLHALHDLCATHEGKVDVIYIDPPYNTGHNDFAYNDNYVNTDDSFRHSKWLSFMDKRLRVAKKLLSDRGVIFISIDDNEDAQLKLLCDEIFLNKNKIADVIWQSRKSVSNDTFVSMNHNYTLIYAKEISNWDKLDFRLPAKTDGFENRDNDPRGPWVADPFDAPNIRPNLTYAIINPNTGKEFWPPKGRCWRTTEEQYLQMLADNRIVFGKNGKTKPQLKRFLDIALTKGETPTTVWNDLETTTDGTKILMEIFGGEKVFTNPKPLSLIHRCLLLASDKESLILDFFAGSGTTLHATMQLNAEDGGHRKCILVTNNENNICEEVTYERNKRVINGYTKPNGEHVPGLTNNNLRYYRTRFVPREKDLTNVMRFARNCVSFLCIKHDVYNEQEKLGNLTVNKKQFRYFKEGDKQFIVILDVEMIEPITKELANMETETPIPTYVFTTGNYPYTEDFWQVSQKVELYPYPTCIYGACEKDMPKMEDKLIDQPENIELTDDEANFSYEDLSKAENYPS